MGNGEKPTASEVHELLALLLGFHGSPVKGSRHADHRRCCTDRLRFEVFEVAHVSGLESFTTLVYQVDPAAPGGSVCVFHDLEVDGEAMPPLVFVEGDWLDEFMALCAEGK